MKKTKSFLYVGQCHEGSTSLMRLLGLQSLLKDFTFTTYDLQEKSEMSNKIFRSLAWRFKTGPLLSKINKEIINLTKNNKFDIIWIDKGVIIAPETVRALKAETKKIIHFTPDPAFTYHQSELFFKSIPYYDYCVTTKSYEIAYYKQYGANVLYCTQGYDPAIHLPHYSFEQKNDVAFIGHHEPDRERILQMVLDNGIELKLAGPNWEKFVQLNSKNKNLTYHGSGLFKHDYTKFISSSLMAFGFVSKLCDEKHTTRTFEIPASGTALISEANEEIKTFFSEEEAILWKHENEIIPLIKTFLTNKPKLEKLTQKGYLKITEGNFSYSKILKKLLEDMKMS